MSIILPVIQVNFNKSLTSPIFPTKWKYSFILPLNKITSPTVPSDYRPINILRAHSK